jgi:hypothetical protein
MRTIKEILRANGCFKMYHHQKMDYQKVAKLIITDNGWDKDRVARMFMEEADEKECRMVACVYTECVRLKLHPIYTKEIVEAVIVPALDWRQNRGW